jgi:hypothetical protein
VPACLVSLHESAVVKELDHWSLNRRWIGSRRLLATDSPKIATYLVATGQEPALVT